MKDNIIYNEINKAWKSTCKVLLEDEIGDLLEYEDYLSKYIDKTLSIKSKLTGKEVIVSSNKFCKDANFISYDEIEQYIKTSKVKIDINKIKDLDSILNSLKEIFIIQRKYSTWKFNVFY